MSEPQKSFVKEFTGIFNVGEIVQVSNKDIKIKYLTHYVGSDSAKTLLTMLPATRQIKQSFGSYKELFHDDDVLVMRMVVDGTVYAFQSKVIGLYTKGSNILVSSIPDEMQRRGLRIETRYPCTMRCTIVEEDKAWEAVVSNISMNGCQLKIPADGPAKEFGALYKIDALIKINIVFPFIEEPGELNAHVKSVSMCDEGSLILGCYFKAPNSSVKRYFELSQLDLVP
ncbi:MAG: PilZ domain-containing protein [Pseudomonadales bacterium]|nr:PilZ domain-containing protein [Pseudomonadales bacterium]